VDTTTVLTALAALGHEHRLAIFRALIEQGPEGLTPGILGERLKLPPATLSFHLKELTHATLIAPRQVGRFIWYRADYDVMNDLLGYLMANCCRSGTACDPACASTPPRKPVARTRPSSRNRRSA
jgi:DNA-binding transcriptional ArsR family regulator